MLHKNGQRGFSWLSKTCFLLSGLVVTTLSSGSEVVFSDIDPWHQFPDVQPTVPQNQVIAQIGPHLWETIDVLDGDPNDGVIRLPGQSIRIQLGDEDELIIKHVMDVSGLDGADGVDAWKNGNPAPTSGQNGGNGGRIYVKAGFVHVPTEDKEITFKLDGGRGGKGGSSRNQAWFVEGGYLCPDSQQPVYYFLAYDPDAPTPPGANGGKGGDAGTLVLDVLYWGRPDGMGHSGGVRIYARGGRGGNGGDGMLAHPEVLDENGDSVTGIANGGNGGDGGAGGFVWIVRGGGGPFGDVSTNLFKPDNSPINPGCSCDASEQWSEATTVERPLAIFPPIDVRGGDGGDGGAGGSTMALPVRSREEPGGCCSVPPGGNGGNGGNGGSNGSVFMYPSCRPVFLSIQPGNGGHGGGAGVVGDMLNYAFPCGEWVGTGTSGVCGNGGNAGEWRVFRGLNSGPAQPYALHCYPIDCPATGGAPFPPGNNNGGSPPPSGIPGCRSWEGGQITLAEIPPPCEYYQYVGAFQPPFATPPGYALAYLGQVIPDLSVQNRFFDFIVNETSENVPATGKFLNKMSHASLCPSSRPGYAKYPLLVGSVNSERVTFYPGMNDWGWGRVNAPYEYECGSSRTLNMLRKPGNKIQVPLPGFYDLYTSSSSITGGTWYVPKAVNVWWSDGWSWDHPLWDVACSTDAEEKVFYPLTSPLDRLSGMPSTDVHCYWVKKTIPPHTTLGVELSGEAKVGLRIFADNGNNLPTPLSATFVGNKEVLGHYTNPTNNSISVLILFNAEMNYVYPRFSFACSREPVAVYSLPTQDPISLDVSCIGRCPLGDDCDPEWGYSKYGFDLAPRVSIIVSVYHDSGLNRCVRITDVMGRPLTQTDPLQVEYFNDSDSTVRVYVEMCVEGCVGFHMDVTSVLIPYLATGWGHTVAVGGGGDVSVWGANWAKQLNLGASLPSPTKIPTPVMGPMLFSRGAVGANAYWTAAITDEGQLRACGENASGQIDAMLGSPVSPSVFIRREDGSVLSQVRMVSCGPTSGHALVGDEGEVWSWGQNDWGQLGIGVRESTTTKRRAVRAILPDGSPLRDVRKVVAGQYACLALCDNGRVLAWGYNNWGQLGTGDWISYSQPTPDKPVVKKVNNTFVPLENIEDIEGSWSTSFAITSDGVLWSWGANEVGQLGDGTSTATQKRIFASPVPLSNVKRVVAGQRTIYALLEDGSLWRWGRIRYPNGFTRDVTLPERVNIPSERKVVEVEGSDYFCHCYTSDGTRWTWGYNNAGQLGTNDLIPVPEPAAIGYPVSP